MEVTKVTNHSLSIAGDSAQAGRLFSIRRVSVFGIVGASCLALQLIVLHLLLTAFSVDSRLGQNVANGAAFLFSAQFNYLLSRQFTWSDRRSTDGAGGSRLRQICAFNLLSVLTLIISQTLFFVAAPRFGEIPASALGVLIASGVTMLASSTFIFRHKSVSHHSVGAGSTAPSFPRISLSSRAFFRATWLRRTWASDPYQLIVLVFGIISSISYYAYYLHQGNLLDYADSISHPMIARRVIDSPTPGFSQLGGVWPPLPHILSLPFIWNNWMYFSGTAGAILSMLSFVVLLVFIYRTARLLNCGPIPGVLAAAVMAINPNMRYMQSISMTELPLLCGIVLAVYFLIRWSQTESVWYMTGVIGAVILTSSTRYEGWALWAAVFVAIGYVMLRKRWSWAKSLDFSVYYLIFAGLFLPAWAIWNKVIVRTGWLGFTQGEYAAPSNWVTNVEPSFGHPWIALKTYWFAMVHIAGLPLVLIAGIGLVLFLVRDRLDPRTSGLLVMLFPVPFFWVMLWNGQRPLHVPEISGDMYNIRFALQMLPFFALMTAILAEALLGAATRSWLRGSIVALLFIGIVAITPMTTITLNEPIAAMASDQLRASQVAAGNWIQSHYPGDGRVLMATPGNEITLFYSRLPLDQVIYEGANKDDLWQNALADPASYVEWVVMDITPDSQDKVKDAMTARPDALNGFDLVYESPNIRIYSRHQ